MPGQTLAQKIIAKACGKSTVLPGEIVTVQVDLAMAHDSSGPRRWRPKLEELDAPLWDPEKVVIVSDHYVPAVDAASAAILQETREFVKDYGVGHFFDMRGICHAVLPENGLVKPGMFIAGGDSHTPTAGAFGAYAAGFGATDMIGIAVTGETWVSVPETILVKLDGHFADGVVAKDLMLRLCRDLGMDNSFKVVEYTGDAVHALSMSERMVLSNMAAELGAETGLIAPDATTLEHIRAHGGEVTDEALSWQGDADAEYEKTYELNVSQMVPQIAAPHSPANTSDVTDIGPVHIDQCYIGACVGAKLEDLQMAARVLKGRKVATSTRLLIAPATTHVTALASADGTLQALTEAGAIIMPSGCGACAGMGAGLLSRGETCLSSTNRNFKGRMGHAEANVYLGSPYSVAAAAVAGEIIDPRELLQGSGKPLASEAA
jgi:3-isopropylmalate/(R)-2-methylmalate dehydratase large subunit